MPARVALDAAPLANRASQEYEALLAASQVHQPRFRWMQRQSEPTHYQPDPPEGFPGLRLCLAHRHKVIAVSDQNSKLATPRRPDPIQLVQVDGYGEILHASHTPKIIVKPCAGKRHARFERGCDGNGSALLIPRHHLPMCGRYRLSRRKQVVEEYFDSISKHRFRV